MTCPATEQVGNYLLRCVMPAGHDGEHWAAELEDAESAQTPAVEADSRRGTWDNGRTNQDGPRRCANTVVPGALPTNKESTSA